MSECSRKDIGLQSVCSPDSPMVSPQDGDMIIENYNKAAKVLTQYRLCVCVCQTFNCMLLLNIMSSR